MKNLLHTDTPHRRRLLRLAGLGVIAAEVVWLLIPPYSADTSRYGEGTRIFDRRGHALRETLGENDQRCIPVKLAQAGAWAQLALIAAEDKRFRQHPGIDCVAMLRAAAQNLVARRRVSGASTITTLVVKLTEPRPRTLWTKIVEAHHAFELERRLSKDDILEQFLNRAPFGSNLKGIETASRHYFGRPAATLSLAEASLLVGLPQAPSRFQPDRHYAAALRRREYVLGRMLARGFITREEHDRAARERPPLSRGAQPFRAPHFCDYLLAEHAGEAELRGTLDPGIQSAAEHVLRQYGLELAAHGVYGGAVVVIDVRESALRAMVGSPDFWNIEHAGQVNGATALRPPGSLLKPFVYGRRIDDGAQTPASILADVRTNFSGYDPRNYGLSYSGPVTLREALVRSLNIPALLAARDIGVPALLRDLRSMGLTTLNDAPGQYGLSLALGACEVRLIDIANAYACLAREGEYRPLRTLRTTPRSMGVRLYSRCAAHILADILGGRERTLAAAGHLADDRLPRVAWKTGTSTGFRDAWTVGYNPDYVVAVWLGNTDNTAAPVLVGIETAAPVMHAVFRRLYPDGDAPWYTAPPGLVKRTVCATSGKRPGRHCPAKAEDLAIAGVSHCDTCDVHRMGPDEQVREVWPRAIQAFMERRGTAKTEQDAAASLAIASPAEGTVVRMIPDSPPHLNQLKLQLSSTAPETKCYWFVDGSLLASASSRRPLHWPLTPGRHRITCTDAEGRCDSVHVTVE